MYRQDSWNIKLLKLLLGLHFICGSIKLLNAKLNPICHLLVLLGAHHILHISRIKVNELSVEHIRLSTFELLNDLWVIIE